MSRNRKKPVGWRGEPKRHSEAAKKGWRRRRSGSSGRNLPRIPPSSIYTYDGELHLVKLAGQKKLQPLVFETHKEAENFAEKLREDENVVQLRHIESKWYVYSRRK